MTIKLEIHLNLFKTLVKFKSRMMMQMGPLECHKMAIT